MIDIEHLLQSFSLREAGEDLEYHPQFLVLAQAIEGGEEVQYGDQVYQPPEVDWRWVADECEQLLQHGLDLRVAVYQSHAWLMRDGLSGFHAGLCVIHFLVTQRWESLHPLLLEEDGQDPLIRLNALAHLAALDTVIPQLKRLPLTITAAGETLSFFPLDDVQGGESDGELREQCLTRLQRLAEREEVAGFKQSLNVLQQVLERVESIHAALSERIGMVAGQPLQALEQVLRRMLSLLRPYAKAATEDIEVTGEAPSNTTDGVSRVHTAALSGECRSRGEVIQALEAVCRYYRTYEPNSPIPLFIERAKKLVEMDFLQIINELTPESMAGIKNLAGLTATDE
ncbi:type VI secretion system protein TssA [Enterobacter cloacae]|uniref:type VI secretion system protein TssA n=1 Tax=Enterobacter cloacae TaxID=550 RepID=UPI00101B0AFF|nr:type VI secretion system protein TssA [Enterobacter cloacae]QBC03361.1 type VI secretion system protein TssA [Enterobacter cloacae]